MAVKRTVILFILFLPVTIRVIGQVPVFVGPNSFAFEDYPSGALKLPPQGNQPSAYNQPNMGSRPVTYTMPTAQNPSATVMQLYNIPPIGATPEEKRMFADEDIRLYELQKQQKKEVARQIGEVVDALHIDYEFPFEIKTEKDAYFLAFEEFSKMLNGDKPLNLKYAVYLAEHAFDPSIKWDEYNSQILQAVSIIGLDMKSNGLSTNDNTAKIMSTFRYMADTISAYSTSREKQITSYPKAYDFEDFWGRHDYRKMFVSKLLSKGSGQCHSMPLLFLILCEEIGAEANLAFAPNHSFVKFKDKRGNWHNLELTNGMLASDHFMVESGFVKAEAIQSRIYLEPISKRQTIVQCLNDLALGYARKFGFDPFVKRCIDLALSYDSNSLTARQLDANYFATLSEYILFQYRVKDLSVDHLKHDKQALKIFESAEAATKYVENLGYTDMPVEAYEIWLKSIQKEASRQAHDREVKLLGGMIER